MVSAKNETAVEIPGKLVAEKMKTLSRHSELAKAFAYALNQWPALTYYEIGRAHV